MKSWLPEFQIISAVSHQDEYVAAVAETAVAAAAATGGLCPPKLSRNGLNKLG